MRDDDNDDNVEADLDEDDDRDDEDSVSVFPRPGATLDGGRIVVDQHVRGRLWTGRIGDRRVLLVHKDLSYVKNRAALDELFRFEVPGIAPLEYLGYADDGGSEVALVEARPEGSPISELESLPMSDVVRCGLGLCDAVLAWSERRESLIVGLRPETVYMSSAGYTGATPRIGLIGGAPDETTFESERYEAPGGCGWLDLGVDDAGFIVAQILWFALLREHPYKFPGALNELDNIWHDRRRPFGGPPELGRILESVLVADPAKRLGARGFRDQLARLASTA